MQYIIIHVKAEQTIYTIEFNGTLQHEDYHSITFKRNDGQLFTYDKEHIIKYETKII